MIAEVYTNWKGEIKKYTVSYTTLPRIGECIELDGIEWVVKSIVHRVLKDSSGAYWVQVPFLNCCQY